MKTIFGNEYAYRDIFNSRIQSTAEFNSLPVEFTQDKTGLILFKKGIYIDYEKEQGQIDNKPSDNELVLRFADVFPTVSESLAITYAKQLLHKIYQLGLAFEKELNSYHSEVGGDKWIVYKQEDDKDIFFTDNGVFKWEKHEDNNSIRFTVSFLGKLKKEP